MIIQEPQLYHEGRIQAAYRDNDAIEIREIFLRPLKQGEIKIKVDACGICGTDLLTPESEEDGKGPFGHEMVGRVLEVGPGVKNVAIGQQVAIESATPCGYCANCHDGKQELCTDIQSFFYLGMFGLAEQTIVPAISALPCEDLEAGVATLSEPLGVAIDLVRLSDITPRSNVLIVGAGTIGLMALALVKRAGARCIFVSELSQRKARIALAKKYGADKIIDPSETSISTYKYGCAIDRILVTAPPPVLSSAFEAASKGAIISFIGIGYGAAGYCNFNANLFHFKKLQLRASFASPAMFTPMALDYLREGIVDWSALITHRYQLANISEAIQIAKNDSSAIKVIVTPGQKSKDSFKPGRRNQQ